MEKIKSGIEKASEYILDEILKQTQIQKASDNFSSPNALRLGGAKTFEGDDLTNFDSSIGGEALRQAKTDENQRETQMQTARENAVRMEEDQKIKARSDKNKVVLRN